jgi:hypothetical protein
VLGTPAYLRLSMLVSIHRHKSPQQEEGIVRPPLTLASPLLATSRATQRPLHCNQAWLLAPPPLTCTSHSHVTAPHIQHGTTSQAARHSALHSCRTQRVRADQRALRVPGMHHQPCHCHRPACGQVSLAASDENQGGGRQQPAVSHGAADGLLMWHMCQCAAYHWTASGPSSGSVRITSHQGAP